MKSRKRKSRLLKPLLMGESRNPRGRLKRLPGVSHYARFILIGKSKQATEPVARKLRDIKGLKVRHFKTTLVDIRDSYRAAGIDPDILSQFLGEKDFDSTAVDEGVTPFQIMVQLLGTNSEEVIAKVCDVIDESSAQLIPVCIASERVNDKLRGRLKSIAMGIERGRIIGGGFVV
jgi:hypothetical protein